MIPTINDKDFKGKRVLVRVDYNVPMSNGEIVDDTRIRMSIPTIKKLFEKGAKQLVLMTHIGRPEGKKVPELRTDKVALRLMKIIGKTVTKVDDCIDIELPDSPIVMLENLRFHKEEEENDPEFAKKLAQNGEIYVNDAFATAHRAHASTTGVTKHLEGCVGLLMEKELKYLRLEEAEKPIIGILGGAKLGTKLPLIKSLLNKVDYLLLGGAMIFTFYKAKGLETGKSLVDEEQILMAQMLANNEKLILPKDVVVAPSENEPEKATNKEINQISKEDKGLDIGEKSINEFKEIIKEAKTIIWNGPLGYVEQEPFDKATKELLYAIVQRTKEGATSIVGGGDSIAYVNKLGLANKLTHVSTGGGASMKLMAGEELPALKALEEQTTNQE